MLTAVAHAESGFQAARAARRRATLVAAAILAAALGAAAWVAEADPFTIAAGLPRAGEYFSRILPTLTWDALLRGSDTEGSLAFWFYRLPEWAWLIFETANMAALATLFGAAAALVAAFPAARNALILVWAFGVGPLAGILAIALHTAGALTKLFAEAIENASVRPWDGLRSAGASWPEACRFAIVPQVLPDLLSQVLLRFEINLRSASVIGFVGAGGIGEELYKVIAFNYYEEISAIILLVIVAVVLTDLLSERLRRLATGALT